MCRLKGALRAWVTALFILCCTFISTTQGDVVDWAGLGAGNNWSVDGNWAPLPNPGGSPPFFNPRPPFRTDAASFPIATTGANATMVDGAFQTSVNYAGLESLSISAAGELTMARNALVEVLGVKNDITSSYAVNGFKINVPEGQSLWVGANVDTLRLGDGSTSGIEWHVTGANADSREAKVMVADVVGPGRWYVEDAQQVAVGILRDGLISEQGTTQDGLIDSSVGSLLEMTQEESEWTLKGGKVWAIKAKNLDAWSMSPTPNMRSMVSLNEFFQIRKLDLIGRRKFRLIGDPGQGPGFNICHPGAEFVEDNGDCIGVFTPSFAESSEIFLPGTEKGVRVLGTLTLHGLGADEGAGPSFTVSNDLARDEQGFPTAGNGRLRRLLLVRKQGANDPAAHISLALASRFNARGSTSSVTDDHGIALFEEGASLRYGAFDADSSQTGEPAPTFPIPNNFVSRELTDFVDAGDNMTNQFHIINKRKSPGTAACCVPDMSACINVGGHANPQISASDECAALNGTLYSGQSCAELDDTECAEAPEDCGTWPALVFENSSYIGLVYGACCHESSCDQMTERECTEVGGCYLGDLSECSASVCSVTSCEGACCDGETCTVKQPGECSGSFQGSGTSCSTAGCDLDASGACCLAGGVCEHLSPQQCINEGGAYAGNGSQCTTALDCETTDYRHLVLGFGETTFDVQTELWTDAGAFWNTRNVDILFYVSVFSSMQDEPKLEAISADVCNVLFLDAPAAKYWRNIGLQDDSVIVKDCRNNQAFSGTEALYFSDDIFYDGSGVELITDSTGPRVYYGGEVYLESGTPGSTIIRAARTRYGDFDADCDVDLHDVLAYQNRFGQDAQTADANLNVQLFDYDGDREVDLTDYDALQLALDTFSISSGNPTSAQCDPSIAANGLDCPFDELYPCEAEQAQGGGGGAAPMSMPMAALAAESLPAVSEPPAATPSYLDASFELWPVGGSSAASVLQPGAIYEVHYETGLDSCSGFVLFAVAQSDDHGLAGAQAPTSGPWAGSAFAYTDLLSMGAPVPATDHPAGNYRFDMVTGDLASGTGGSSGVLGQVSTEQAGTLQLQAFFWTVDAATGQYKESMGQAAFSVVAQ